MREIALFPVKIYTSGTNFTRLLVVTVATNLNSAADKIKSSRLLVKKNSQLLVKTRTIHLLVKVFPSELLLSNMDMRRITIKASLQLPRQHCSLNICRYIGWVDTYCTISEAKIQITLLKMRRGASLQFLSNDWIWWAGLYYLRGVWQGLAREGWRAREEMTRPGIC